MASAKAGILPAMDTAATFSFTTAGHLEALGDLRPALRRWLLQDVGMEHADAEDLVLAAWEICANAIEHPRERTAPSVDVDAWASTGAVCIAVRDTGSWLERPVRRPSRGLGLRIARALVDRMSILSGQTGTEVVLWRYTGGSA